MNKISSWSLLGYLASIIYAGVTIYHFWIKFPDTSQFILNMAVACLIAGTSWLFNQQKQMSYSIDAMGEFLEDKEFIVKSKEGKKLDKFLGDVA